MSIELTARMTSPLATPTKSSNIMGTTVVMLASLLLLPPLAATIDHTPQSKAFHRHKHSLQALIRSVFVAFQQQQLLLLYPFKPNYLKIIIFQ